MTGKLVFEERLHIPLDVGSLDAFRRWALSDDFPEEGRIDFVASQIEVDMSPEDLFTHGTVKTEFVSVLRGRVKSHIAGHLFSDRTRVSSVPGELSAEPDVIFVSAESLASGRVRLVPKATGEPGRYVEVEGAPDVVVEIVSDSSVGKDTQRLLTAYFRAGVLEYWLVDARGDELRFTIHHRSGKSFEPVAVSEGGTQLSEVFAARFHLVRTRGPGGGWDYNLVLSASGS